MLLKYHFLEVHDIILVLKSFIEDFIFYFWHSLRGCQFFINFRTKGFQSHHKEDCVFNAHTHVAVELSVLAINWSHFYKAPAYFVFIRQIYKTDSSIARLIHNPIRFAPYLVYLCNVLPLAVTCVHVYLLYQYIVAHGY